MPADSRGHILVADDDTHVLKATEAALSLSGFEVTAVENGPQALVAMEAQTPDALLLDINMPGNQDLELVAQVSKSRPLIPILILTGYPTLDTAMRAVRLGALDYITKPHKMDQLLERLDVAVHRARVLRSIGEAESLAEQLSQRLEALRHIIDRAPGNQLAPLPDTSEATSPLDPLRNLSEAESAKLSAREREVLRELARGQSPQKIAEALQLSTNTVRNHLKSIFLKLGVNSQVALLGRLAARSR
jgi:DNA-binding NarL/FixJ family response regulator